MTLMVPEEAEAGQHRNPFPHVTRPAEYPTPSSQELVGHRVRTYVPGEGE